MRHFRSPVAALAMSVLALAACGVGAPPPTQSAPTSTPTPAPVSTGPVPSSTGGAPTAASRTPTASPGHVISGVLTLGSADGGRSLTVPHGTIIEVVLAGNVGQPVYVWSDVTDSNPVVISPSGVTTHSGGGVQASFFAAATGHADLSAHDDPTCTHDVPPCGVPSMLWTVTLEVD